MHADINSMVFVSSRVANVRISFASPSDISSGKMSLTTSRKLSTSLALYLGVPGGRSSSTDFATAAAAAPDVPLALDSGGPLSSEDSSSEDSASSDSVMALHFAFPRGRASSAHFAVTSALVVPFALVQEDPAAPEDCASSDSGVTLCFTKLGGRASPTDFVSAVVAALVVSSLQAKKTRLHQKTKRVFTFGTDTLTVCFGMRSEMRSGEYSRPPREFRSRLAARAKSTCSVVRSCSGRSVHSAAHRAARARPLYLNGHSGRQHTTPNLHAPMSFFHSAATTSEIELAYIIHELSHAQYRRLREFVITMMMVVVQGISSFFDLSHVDILHHESWQ